MRVRARVFIVPGRLERMRMPLDRHLRTKNTTTDRLPAGARPALNVHEGLIQLRLLPSSRTARRPSLGGLHSTSVGLAASGQVVDGRAARVMLSDSRHAAVVLQSRRTRSERESRTRCSCWEERRGNGCETEGSVRRGARKGVDAGKIVYSEDWMPLASSRLVRTRSDPIARRQTSA